jgi:peptidoglycan biosynthesis protein MviN/MurJ (putative lipid II flippase)
VPVARGELPSRPLDVPALEPRRIAGNAVLTAVAQVLVMVVGGVLAVLILFEFGKSSKTDGLFAAYGAYGIVVALAQSLRGTIVARLLEGDSLAANLDAFLGNALLVFAATAVPFVVLGGPVAHLLTGSLGQSAAGSARDALLILWLAAGAQLAAALAAAALAIYNDYRAPALAYVAGSGLALVALVGLAGPLGITAAPVALALGSCVTALVMLRRLRRFGYRADGRRVLAGARSVAGVRLIAAASAGSVAGQITYLVSLGAAARIGAGAVTLYSYAFFAAMVFAGASALPIGTVMAPAISEAWDRRPESLGPAVAAVQRVGFVLIVPALALVAVAGRDLVQLVLGSKLSHHDVGEIVNVVLALGGVLVATVAQTVPLIAAYAAGMYGRVAVASGAILAVQVGGAALAVATGDLVAVAIASSATALIALAVFTAVVHGRHFAAPLLTVLRELAVVLAVAAAAFGPPALLARPFGTVAHVASGVAGLALFVVLVFRLLPAHRRLVADALAPVLAGRRAEPANA